MKDLTLDGRSPVKRVNVGSFVVFDATGMNDIIIGVVAAKLNDRGLVLITPADGTEDILTGKATLFKATKEEFGAVVDDSIADLVKEEGSTSASNMDEATKVASEEEEGEEGSSVNSHMASALNNTGYVSRTVEHDGVKHNTKDCGDYVATYLTQIPAQDLHILCANLHAKYGQEAGGKCEQEWRTNSDAIKQKYADLNKGHQRLCIGNLIRALYKKMVEITGNDDWQFDHITNEI